MKETNSLETLLSSWRPRRPSARLKSRIFAEAKAPRPAAVAAWSLLAPAAACVLVAFSALNPAGHVTRATFGDEAPLGLLASNPVALPPDIYSQEHNELSTFTFEWTNRSGSTSSISSFSPGK